MGAPEKERFVFNKKVCRICGKKKSVNDFYKDKSKKDGYRNECKTCHLEQKINAGGTVVRQQKRCCVCKAMMPISEFCASRWSRDGHANQCRACAGEYMKDYRQTSKGKEVDRRAAMKYHYTERGQEVYKNAQKRYKESDKGKATLRAAWIRRRARSAESEGSFTGKQWRDLCKKYNHRCACCGAKAPLEADHVIPLSKGGSSYISNIQPLCRSCNASKNDKVIDYRK